MYFLKYFLYHPELYLRIVFYLCYLYLIFFGIFLFINSSTESVSHRPTGAPGSKEKDAGAHQSPQAHPPNPETPGPAPVHHGFPSLQPRGHPAQTCLQHTPWSHPPTALAVPKSPGWSKIGRSPPPPFSLREGAQKLLWLHLTSPPCCQLLPLPTHLNSLLHPYTSCSLGPT